LNAYNDPYGYGYHDHNPFGVGSQDYGEGHMGMVDYGFGSSGNGMGNEFFSSGPSSSYMSANEGQAHSFSSGYGSGMSNAMSPYSQGGSYGGYGPKTGTYGNPNT